MVVRDKAVAKDSYIKDAISYLWRAALVVVVLMIVGHFAPRLPSFVLPFVFGAYAFVSTIGAMYSVVVNRQYRQYKLNKDGWLSSRNRKWKIWLAVTFLLSIISAFMFVLDAPRWEWQEWLVIWLGIIGYYLVYLAVQWYFKKLLAPKYYKASAMKWSFIIVAIILCVIYAVFGVWDPVGGQTTIQDALQYPCLPYENSSSKLMGEIDKLVEFSDSLTRYGLTKLVANSFVVAFVVRFVMFASVFFGLVNLYGFCLLSKEECINEFRLLPSYDEEFNDQPIEKPYFAIIAAIWLVCTVVFLGFEYETAKLPEDSDTCIDKFVDESTNEIVAFVDLYENRDSFVEVVTILEKVDELKDIKNDYDQKLGKLKAEDKEQLILEVNNYYDKCNENVDSYLDWYYGWFGGFAKTFKSLGKTSALDNFKEKVSNPVDDSELKAQYEKYVESAENLYVGYWNKIEGLSPDDNSTKKIAQGQWEAIKTLELWQPLTNNNKDKVINDVLLCSNEGISREELKNKIVELIEQAKSDTLSSIDSVI